MDICKWEIHKRMAFKLFHDKAPYTVSNFHALCTSKMGVSPKIGKLLSYLQCFLYKVDSLSHVKGGALCPRVISFIWSDVQFAIIC
ncbi:peptidyl-prolyl cis-trans isomerase D-like isoform X2 [Prosopis cineraria]|uniref:peptidyl-prolyl cis-trans isomerase D-like isoform X2 n=1 Tax=Prosopis cineraria TaxID=364024 RepID=UPI00240F3C87|nr:peptidyl-prolyl cis-trans isomerase D-like isoform X2 [Prosopis cineraria]